jgi:hypothetical protein
MAIPSTEQGRTYHPMGQRQIPLGVQARFLTSLTLSGFGTGTGSQRPPLPPKRPLG